MEVFVDATNIKGGGGRTNLIGLLAHSGKDDGIHYTVLCGTRLAAELAGFSHLEVVSMPIFDGSFLKNILWHRRNAKSFIADRNVDLVYFPGTSRLFDFSPYVTVSQNMIPFMPEEIGRFGHGLQRLKFTALGRAHRKALAEADGAIFLNAFAMKTIGGQLGPARGLRTVIPNGTDASFARAPRAAKPFAEFSAERPFQLLYVSTVNWYKHQWNVAEAVARLAKEGLPVHLHLVGGGPKKPRERLERILHTNDPEGQYVTNHGLIPHEKMAAHYEAADGFLFASTCENMPIILIEAMMSGLPILCTDKEPMKGILGDAGQYFDPLSVEDIAAKTKAFIEDQCLRKACAEGSPRQAAKLITWEECAKMNVDFFKQVAAKTSG